MPGGKVKKEILAAYVMPRGMDPAKRPALEGICSLHAQRVESYIDTIIKSIDRVVSWPAVPRSDTVRQQPPETRHAGGQTAIYSKRRVNLP